MNIFDSSPAQVQPIQKAVVAFSSLTTNVAILWCTPFLADDIENAMLGCEDVFPHGDDNNPNQGIWIWEGKIIGIIYPSTPDTAQEYDVEYRGEWRPPTEEEWTAIRKNQSPWEDAER